MPVYVKITQPDGMEKQEIIEAGTPIGRSPGGLKIDDPRASAMHAELTWHEASAQYLLKDLGSRNGIRTGQRVVRELVLQPGICFYIGETGFEVLSIESENSESKAVTPETTSSGVELSPQNWEDYFIEFCDRAKTKIKNQTRDIKPFFKILEAHALRGIQMEQTWTLGYGPRQFGKNSLDCTLLEPNCPDVAFTLQPKDQEIVFETQHKKIVRLNQREIHSDILKTGDQISIGETVIEISFIE